MKNRPIINHTSGDRSRLFEKIHEFFYQEGHEAHEEKNFVNLMAFRVIPFF